MICFKYQITKASGRKLQLEMQFYKWDANLTILEPKHLGGDWAMTW